MRESKRRVFGHKKESSLLPTVVTALSLSFFFSLPNNWWLGVCVGFVTCPHNWKQHRKVKMEWKSRQPIHYASSICENCSADQPNVFGIFARIFLFPSATAWLLQPWFLIQVISLAFFFSLQGWFQILCLIWKCASLLSCMVVCLFFLLSHTHIFFLSFQIPFLSLTLY